VAVFSALSGACALCSCSGAVHQLPQISPGNLALAQAEVQEGGPVGLYRVMTDEQALLTLRRTVQLVRSPAEQLCREMNVSVCRWDIRASPDRSLDATARPNDLIMIYQGLRNLAWCCYILLESIAPVSDDPISGLPAVAATS
jgi:hypothetical protein